MNKTILLINIGPVQDFIASARKLRDLWFGSFILSELSKAVARYLQENGASLIFPSPNDVQDLMAGSDFNVANKIIAEVENLEAADQLQKGAKDNWIKTIEEIGRKTIDKITSECSNLVIDSDRFMKECRDYGEFYAVWVEYEADNGYPSAWMRLHELLSARKRTRTFTAPTWDTEFARKNSLDGMRETVFKNQEIKEIPGVIKKNERLDAIGCIKRFYPFTFSFDKKKYFDDLADIALVPWLEGIRKDADISNLENFQKIVTVADKRLKRTNQWPIENDKLQTIVSELYFSIKKEIEVSVGVANVEKIVEARNELFRNYRDPEPYAMILHGDGDRVGKFIDAITNVEGHRDVAKKLSEFAKKVAGCVTDNDNEGSLIYAGGDDVLAILPLHTGLKCAEQLRKDFHEHFQKLHKVLNLNSETQIPTFSIGIAIVHYLEPLDQALDIARRAEKLAKNNGRNSLAVIQSKRSGPEVAISGKWEQEGDLPGISERISEIIKLYKQKDKVLSTRIGYQLRKIAKEAGDEMSFCPMDGMIIPTNPAAAMAKRLFAHKNDGDKKKEEQLLNLLKGRNAVRLLADELVVGRLIADAELMAEGEKRK